MPCRVENPESGQQQLAREALCPLLSLPSPTAIQGFWVRSLTKGGIMGGAEDLPREVVIGEHVAPSPC